MGKRPLLINNNAETFFLMNISYHRDAPILQVLRAQFPFLQGRM